MAQIKVLIVDPDGGIRVAEIENELGAFQAVVDGYTEPVYGRVATVYVNEEGILRSLPINPMATLFAERVLSREARYPLSREARYPLVGTVLIVGPADTEGNDTDVRPAVVDYFTKEN